MRIAFYGPSLLSACRNGAATSLRGILSALARHRITLYEPDALDRQSRRDIDPPDYAEVVAYPASAEGLRRVVAAAADADVVVKASGVGVFDDEFLDGLLAAARLGALRIFWDVDAPATLAEMQRNPGQVPHRALPHLDWLARRSDACRARGLEDHLADAPRRAAGPARPADLAFVPG